MNVAPRRLGDDAIFPVAFGAMNLSLGPSREAALTALRAAFEAGMEVVDTADVYGPDAASPHHNEALVGCALRDWSASRIRVATKVGVVREGEAWLHRGDPAHLRRSCEDSLRALGVEAVDLLQLHALPDDVPLDDALGALERLRDEGKARAIGVSNVPADALTDLAGRLRAARCVSVQNETSPYVPPPRLLLDQVAANQWTLLGYAPMGGWRAERTAHEGPLRAAADAIGATPFEVVLAWLLARSPNLVPVCGGTSPVKIASSARAASIVMPPEVCVMLDDAYGPRAEL